MSETLVHEDDLKLVTDKDMQNLKKIRKILDKLDNTDGKTLDFENMELSETLERVIINLSQGHNYFKKLPESEQKWYDAECESCGWFGSSQYCGGGYAIADTGDYSDPTCPVCSAEKIM